MTGTATKRIVTTTFIAVPLSKGTLARLDGYGDAAVLEFETTDPIALAEILTAALDALIPRRCFK